MVVVVMTCNDQLINSEVVEQSRYQIGDNLKFNNESYTVSSITSSDHFDYNAVINCIKLNKEE